MSQRLCYTAANYIMASCQGTTKADYSASLRITDLTPEDLRDDQPLLGGDLEIDSIDILQLILEIERHFGIKLVEAKFDEKACGRVSTLSQLPSNPRCGSKT
jgi:acyl carrier protein